LYAFNNTIVVEGVATAVSIRNNSSYLKNNLIKTNGGVGIYKDPAASTFLVENCATSDGTADDFGGTGNKVNQIFDFVNEAGYDFHLAQTDTSARGAGANLSADTYLPFSTDIDGQLRNPSGTGWDIGADEGTKEFVSTVMQSGGNFSTLSSWEDAIDSDLVADTTRVFSHGGITGTIVGGNTVTGLTSGATATVVYATATQILLHTVSGIFQSGETLQVTVGNSVVISDNGNPASAVAKIDGAWTVADTTAVMVDGWTSGPDNYIKIYTAPDARHSGKWDNSKYRMEIYRAEGEISPRESNVKIEGLQFTITSASSAYTFAIDLHNLNNLRVDIEINDNIFKGSTMSVNRNAYIYVSNTSIGKIKIWNNFFLPMYLSYPDTVNGAIVAEGANSASLHIFNNTFYKTIRGIQKYNTSVTVVANNNIVNDCSSNCYSGSFDLISSNNISSDATAPGSSGSKINAEVKFVSTEAGNEDFHLHPDDRFAKDAGTDLSTYFTNDIDGQTRLRQDSGVAQWDIGADETATRIYRSVGPGATGLLASDSSHANTVTLTSGVATFSAALADNIGVGDAVIIDTNGGTGDQSIASDDTLLFIHSRTSSTSYTFRTHTGATPSDITINDTYQIYRAHTSLANAEAGTINSTLSTMGFTFNGGNRDLVANNEQWNIACYANGTTADTTVVAVDGWVTGVNNFLKIYTPVEINEVGVTQRHDGKWDENKYRINGTTDLFFRIEESFVAIDGLQFYQSLNFRGILIYGAIAGSKISNSIIKGNAGITNEALIDDQSSGGDFYFYNNVVYDSLGYGYFSRGAEVELNIYNNTFYNLTTGIYRSFGAIMAKNNIVQNCVDGYWGAFDASSDYNISDLAADAPGTNSKNSTDVLFLDEVNDDFRLSSDDTAAKGAGLNLSTDANLSFFDDIRGQSRPASPTAWSIGASEPQGAGKIKLEGTQIKMEGDAKFE
jgi:hypothetical protein